MGLLELVGSETLAPTARSREFLTPGSEFDLGGYIGLAAQTPGVRTMLECLQKNRPIGSSPRDGGEGVGFIFREGLDSAMEAEASARRLTLALAGRARVVAPALTRAFPLAGAQKLVDIGGGSGIYAIAYARSNPRLRAVVWDRPEVLKVASEMCERFGVGDRVECVAGDMFEDEIPDGNIHLFSNILHDWDVAECRRLIARSAAGLPDSGQMLIHDVFLNDDLAGPLAIALYSASLFALTEGRAYSAGEYRGWLEGAGLRVGGVRPTAAHCGVMAATK
jgi:predicted O-methyltransferase YrrM